MTSSNAVCLRLGVVAAQGGSNGAIDNDDESLRYDNNHNFQVYGHQKFKTGAIRSYGNVIACKRTDITESHF